MEEQKSRGSQNRTIFLSPEEEGKILESLPPLEGPLTPENLQNRIINGDIFDLLPRLPDAFVDLLFLDPPYNLTRSFNSSTFVQMNPEKYHEWFGTWFEPMMRCLKPGASVYVCADWRMGSVVQSYLEKHLIVRNRITWERDKGRGARSNWKNNAEDIWFATRTDDFTFNVDAVKIQKKVIAPYRNLGGSPRGWENSGSQKVRLTYPSNIWTDLTVPFWSMAENTDHPTQKPEKMLARIILASSQPGDLIMDPFAGSGTTPAVCKKLGRRYLAIEKDPGYAALGIHRTQKAESGSSIQGYVNGFFLERNAKFIPESELEKGLNGDGEYGPLSIPTEEPDDSGEASEIESSNEINGKRGNEPMTDFQLERNKPGVDGSLLLIILDGVGIAKGHDEGYDGNALDQAKAPFLKELLQTSPVNRLLQAHGTAVGLPSDDDMGNSEVGHNAMGAGRVFDQGAKLVSAAVQSGELFRGQSWMEMIGSAEKPGHAVSSDKPVHFIGLLSDGNVHSHIDHLKAMVSHCARAGVKKVFIHPLLDGRDVDEVSAHIYLEEIEKHLKEECPADGTYRVASGGGRMTVTMDRYEADWSMVELGWKTHVKGEGRGFSSAQEALQVLRSEGKDGSRVVDQYMPPFVIVEDGKPVGPIDNDDVVIFFNFRGDRAIEISRAFTDTDFTKFTRDPAIKAMFAGMMEYDGDLHIPPRYLVSPPSISRTVSEYLARNGIRQYAISETQKFGHVTYFWNGNNSEKFDRDLETWVEIPSDRIPYDQAPAMKATEITAELKKAMVSKEYDFLRVNFANGDMVGHTGVLAAAVSALETLDGCLVQLLETARETGTTVMITADHGNCDEMYSMDKSGAVKLDSSGIPIPRTSHTLNPVPFILTGPGSEKFQLSAPDAKMGIASIAPTILEILGFTPPGDYLPSIVKAK